MALAQTHPRLVAGFYERALGARPFLRARLGLDVFARALDRSVAHRFRDTHAPRSEVSAYLGSLHVEDLALAAACAEGDEAAWEHVMTTFRPTLYAAARALTNYETAARELADTLWAELYGVGGTRASVETGSARRPLLTYFHGRSKLSTWLRSVLAQRHVDRLRGGRRFDSLDAENAEEPVASTNNEPPDPDRDRYRALLDGAVAEAVGRLAARDRLRLGLYYVQGLTLAEIGRVTQEHEATVSRKLANVRKRLRTEIEGALQEAGRLSEAEIRLCYQYALEEGAFDLGAVLEAPRSAP